MISCVQENLGLRCEPSVGSTPQASEVHRAQDTESCRDVSSDSYTMGFLPNTSREVTVSPPGVFKIYWGFPSESLS